MVYKRTIEKQYREGCLRNRSMAVHFMTLLLSCLTLEFFLYKSVLGAGNVVSLFFWGTVCIATSLAVFPLIFICLSGLAYIGTSLV